MEEIVAALKEYGPWTGLCIYLVWDLLIDKRNLVKRLRAVEDSFKTELKEMNVKSLEAQLATAAAITKISESIETSQRFQAELVAHVLQKQ